MTPLIINDCVARRTTGKSVSNKTQSWSGLKHCLEWPQGPSKLCKTRICQTRTNSNLRERQRGRKRQRERNLFVMIFPPSINAFNMMHQKIPFADRCYGQRQKLGSFKRKLILVVTQSLLFGVCSVLEGGGRDISSSERGEKEVPLIRYITEESVSERWDLCFEAALFG